jgi:hypothetical protein
MTSEEIVRLIFSFLGGGLVSGLLTYFGNYRSEKKRQKISNLQATLQNLYGPLQFFASQNKSYFELNNKFHAAYQTEYVGQKWSKDDLTQERLGEATSKTLTQNNERILDVLRNNYSYIDPDDVEVFRQLVVDYTRLKTEVDESGRLNTPLEIYEHIGEISFMRTEFIARIEEKFNSKKKELEPLIS